MKLIDSFLAELDQEAKTTRKFLEAVPADKMGWQPHDKSMTTGKLAWHIATLQGHLVDWGMVDEFTMPQNKDEEKQHTKEEILAAFDKNLAHAKEQLAKVDDKMAMGTWKFMMNGKVLMEMPRIGFFRFWMMNHLYHHRGQFGVYLRLLGAHVPSSYGPSADENPMAKAMEMANA